MRWILAAFFTCLLIPSSATGDSLRYLTPEDTIFITVSNSGEKIFEHVLVRGQTLFSLARFYGLRVADLQYYNPGLSVQTLKVGQRIRIPIPNRAIVRYLPPEVDARSYFAPIFYIVRKGDTMFSLSRRYFRMPMDTLRQRGDFEGNGLRVGQRIPVGWLSIEGIPDSFHNKALPAIFRANYKLQPRFESCAARSRIAEDQGVASWKKEESSKDYFALHRTAPLRSVLEIYNPMTGRKVYAKIVDRIPPTAYDDNVVVVLSSPTARLLGAIDERFFVRLKYCK